MFKLKDPTTIKSAYNLFHLIDGKLKIYEDSQQSNEFKHQNVCSQFSHLIAQRPFASLNTSLNCSLRKLHLMIAISFRPRAKMLQIIFQALLRNKNQLFNLLLIFNIIYYNKLIP